MSRTRPIGCLLLTIMLVVSMTAPVAAVSGQTNTNSQTNTILTASDEDTNVTVGQQLSTVLSTTSGEVEADLETTAFEVRYEQGNASARAQAVAERSIALSEESADINDDYQRATETYKNGQLTQSEYAQRLAMLNSRARNVQESISALEQRAVGVSADELAAAGYDEATLAEAKTNLETVSGSGATALFQRFAGETTGEFELDVEHGLSVEFKNEDGERSREIRQPRDNSTEITVSQSAAAETAAAALSNPVEGEWVLEEASVHEESGYFKFEYVLDSDVAEGETEIRVDGSSGKLFRLEEEIEGPESESEDDEDENESSEHEDEDFQLIVADGTPGPNETVTLQAVMNDQPVPNLDVYMNDELVGTTDESGMLTVTLPSDDEAEFNAQKGEAEAELEFEFEEEDDDDDDDDEEEDDDDDDDDEEEDDD